MGCMSARSRGQPKASAAASASGGSSSSTYHAWDVILKYYKMKGGPEYNAAPARKLSQSFGLDLAGTTQNNRQLHQTLARFRIDLEYEDFEIYNTIRIIRDSATFYSLYSKVVIN